MQAHAKSAPPLNASVADAVEYCMPADVSVASWPLLVTCVSDEVRYELGTDWSRDLARSATRVNGGGTGTGWDDLWQYVIIAREECFGSYGAQEHPWLWCGGEVLAPYIWYNLYYSTTLTDEQKETLREIFDAWYAEHYLGGARTRS